MTPKQAAFVQEYLVDLCGTKAAIRAGYAERSAKKIAHELLQKPEIQQQLQAAMAARAARVELEADDVLRDLVTIAQADPRELVEFRRTCCRYCWGKGNRYQRTAGEMERDRESHHALIAAAKAKRKPGPGPFDPKGGIGYHAKRDPSPSCGECFGDGIGRTHLHDTRHVSPAAARLYAGVKESKEGLEVRLRDQDGALVNLGRHLGLFTKDKLEVDLNVRGSVSYRANIPKRGT